MIFVIEFDRRTSTLLRCEPYEDSQMTEAADRKLQIELASLPDIMNREIVLLTASTKESLYESHGRYFNGIDRMIENILGRRPSDPA